MSHTGTSDMSFVLKMLIKYQFSFRTISIINAYGNTEMMRGASKNGSEI